VGLTILRLHYKMTPAQNAKLEESVEARVRWKRSECLRIPQKLLDHLK
jgi:hypothetical protein